MLSKEFWKKLGLNREVAALSLARFVDAFSNSILIIILPLYVGALPSGWFDLPVETLVGILIFTFGIVSSFSQPFAGKWSDRVQKRKVFIIVGLALLGLSTFIFVAAEQFLHLIVVRAVQGFGFALTIPATFSLMTAYTRMENRGGAMGIYSTMRMAGFAVGPLLGGILHVYTGFKTAFYVVGILSLVGAFIVWRLVEDPVRVDRTESQTRQLPRFSDSISYEFLILAASTIVMASAISMMVALENQFNERLSQTAIGFGIAFSALTISRGILQIPLGKAADIWGRKPLIMVGLLLLTPTTILLGYVATTGQLVVVRLAQGVAMAGISAPVFALAADKTDSESAGTQMSIITMSFGIGIAFGPVLAGFMAGYVSFQSPFIVAGISCFAMAVLMGKFVEETVLREDS